MKAASAHIVQNDAAYGLLCGWIAGILEGRHTRQDELIAVVEQNLALVATELRWAMEYFEPLRQILDELTGMPDVVASHTATWMNMAGELRSMATDLTSHLGVDLPDWRGSAATAYQGLMGHNVNALDGLSGVSAAMAAATQAAGNLVAFTRDIVRDLIADLVARVIVWAPTTARSPRSRDGRRR